ncbi:FMN-binding glutamate synthase family protein [Singulisphaera acidiphila]|uniref:Glutamate synthase family protein n=1 Tax=Singulisphaera acidiphila (strain ATCC BAA-1392 / DSM 18658 / VKM B-2454 / MOB10) TaxID=886293 RepID=L0D8Q7_SINAD|nr:FMN-binding glutamate synthase family protein [Singulisphaera acidiphila]AGA25250.1 glutamate synthase family protein [Singulisphaera acidiphila DSM 18658]
MSDSTPPPGSAADPSPMERSGTFTPGVIEDIQIKAELARYRIRGFGILRPRTWATFDDLTFVPGTLTRIPLEGYREKCSTKTVLGTRFASQPLELDIPLMVTGMSYGALSRNAKTALSRGARMAGTSTTTGDGGMLDVERSESRAMIYEVLPSRYGINVQHLRQADAIELTIGQGAKPGTGGLLLGSKVSDEVARLRDLPPGVDQRSPCRHPDFLGPDDMVIKIEELREATDWRIPIFVKMGASRVFDDVRLAAKAGADVVVVDGMEGGTGASPELLQEHTGIPTLAAVCEARAALEDIGLYGKVQLVIAGGLRHGSDCAKALALGADACYLGTALLIALNCNKPIYVEDYHAIGAAPYACHHCHTGRCPVGITTQDPELTARLEVDAASERVASFFHALTSEVQVLARACGKSDVHHLEPEDLRALTLEASMITGLPLAGTNRVYGGGPGWASH